jgi:hypothetical protein
MLIITKHVSCSESQNPGSLFLSHNKASCWYKLKMDSLHKERSRFEEYCLLWCNFVEARSLEMFQRNIFPGLKSKASKQYIPMKNLVNFYQSMWCHIPEYSTRTFHSHCMNFKANINFIYYDCICDCKFMCFFLIIYLNCKQVFTWWQQYYNKTTCLLFWSI